MSYDDEDTRITVDEFRSDEACKLFVIILTVLMIIIALPSILDSAYGNTPNGIISIGFAALIMSILYLASKVEKLAKTDRPL